MAKKKLEGIVWPNLPDDTYYLDAEKVEYDNTENYPDGSVGKALNEKANVDGYYSNLTAGNAEQLISNVRANDKTPYLFRTSGGSVDIGDREYINGIVGGTIAWNQVVQNGNFGSTSYWGVPTGFSVADNIATLTPPSSGDIYSDQNLVLITGHKYLYSVDAKADDNATSKEVLRIFFGASSNRLAKTVSDSNWNNVAGCFECLGTTLNKFRLPNYFGNTTTHWKNAQIFDLTQMFGSTIADYIYSLEQANAGAGVAWFRKLFNKPYYAYNAGELKSVSGLVSHDMTGFNQWDEEWVNGYVNSSSGEITSNNNYLCSKNLIPIASGVNYYIKVPAVVNIHKYDANGDYMGVVPYTWGNEVINAATYLKDVAYIRFNSAASGAITTYNHDICINISWDGSRNGEYEPYELHSYPLDSDLTLRGIPKLDANNNLYYDGDTYESDGTVTRKYGIVDLGTLTWTEYGSTETVTQYVTGGLDSVIKENSSARTTRFVYSATLIPWTWRVGSGNGKVVLRTSKDAYESASAFKTAMSGVYFVYELATPTTETADAYVGTQIVNDFGTEEYVFGDSAFPIPVGHNTDYPLNLVAKLEMAPNSPEGNGDYIVRQTNGTNEYVPLVIEDALPTMPSTAGSYKLTVTVAEGSDPVLSWEAE